MLRGQSNWIPAKAEHSEKQRQRDRSEWGEPIAHYILYTYTHLSSVCVFQKGMPAVSLMHEKDGATIWSINEINHSLLGPSNCITRWHIHNTITSPHFGKASPPATSVCPQYVTERRHTAYAVHVYAMSKGARLISRGSFAHFLYVHRQNCAQCAYTDYSTSKASNKTNTLCTPLYMHDAFTHASGEQFSTHHSYGSDHTSLMT